MTIPASPLAWPTGWKRTEAGARTTARFNTKARGSSSQRLTIAESVLRVREVLDRMGIRDDDLVISSNLELRLDGFPKSNQPEPADPGVAVYWRGSRRDGTPMRCMAIDRYDRVADNLAAIAATLDAMRAIERHGGAAILDRAFTGFVALESRAGTWWAEVLAVSPDAPESVIRDRYLRLRSLHHPDRGGDPTTFQRVQEAYEAYSRDAGNQE